MDDADQTIEALCRLPIDFHTLGNVSAVDLVVRSGYPAIASQVTADRARWRPLSLKGLSSECCTSVSSIC